MIRGISSQQLLITRFQSYPGPPWLEACTTASVVPFHCKTEKRKGNRTSSSRSPDTVHFSTQSTGLLTSSRPKLNRFETNTGCSVFHPKCVLKSSRQHLKYLNHSPYLEMFPPHTNKLALTVYIAKVDIHIKNSERIKKKKGSGYLLAGSAQVCH